MPYFFNSTMLESNNEKELMESPKKLFNTQFRLHIEKLHYVYGIPLATLNNICNSLIKFIKKQVEFFSAETKSANNYTISAKI